MPRRGIAFSLTSAQRSLSKPRPEYHGITLHETFGNFALAIACRVLALREGPSRGPLAGEDVLTLAQYRSQ